MLILGRLKDPKAIFDIHNEKGVEQFTKADLLAVTLFEDLRDIIIQNGVPSYAGSITPPFCVQYR